MIIINIELNKIYNIDCLEGMRYIEDKSIDMILCDLPYGQTARNKWDTVIPFDELWKQYNRVIKDNGGIVLFANGMFTADLMQSNKKYWKYNLIWDKDGVTGHLNAKKQPLRQHEDICVFYKKPPTYNPQMTQGKPYQYSHYKYKTDSSNYGEQNGCGSIINNGLRYPTSIIKFKKINPKQQKILHPTQKNVNLLEYLIKTYTNENETVLDNCIGSGSTAIACINTNRNYIGFELDKGYFDIANERIDDFRRSN